MAAYVIADVSVTDPGGYEDYRRGVLATVERYGGRFLVRGGAVQVAEGSWQPARVVVLEFPTMADLRRWYDSPEYRPLKAMRLRTARTDVIFAEGA